MFTKSAKNRITALMLALVMVLSVPGYVLAEETEPEYDGNPNEYAVEDSSETDGADVSAGDEEDSAEPAAAEGSDADAGSEESADTADAAEPEAAADETDPAEPEGAVPEENAEEAAEPESKELPEIRISAAGEDGLITVVWSELEGADYYIVRLDEDEARTKVMVSENTELRTVLRAEMGTDHSVTVEAYISQPEGEDGDQLIGRGVLEGVSPSVRDKITKKSLTPSRLGFNLRSLIGEPFNGYAVVQGGVTDGTYAYSMMVSSYTQKGRLLKTVVGTDTVVDRSEIIDILHGNGMALNTEDGLIVVSSRQERRNQVTLINVDDPAEVSYENIDYSYPGCWQNKDKSKGITNISYIPKYDCYLCLQKKTREILVLDRQFKVIGQVGTKIIAKYPGVYQAMDADERYVYLLLSADDSKQPYNLILVLDWNSENLLDVLNGNKEYIGERWLCNNDGSGKPDTVIRIKTPYEAENLYHVDQEDGTARFYLSEYHKNPTYKTVTKTKTVKVKWKKVRKKVKVKWKKVKRKGKWKWKYRYKWKKVWKYKKKKKKYTVSVFSHNNRDNYVYEMGSF